MGFRCPTVLWPSELLFVIDARATYEDLYALLGDLPTPSCAADTGLAMLTHNRKSIDQLELAFQAGGVHAGGTDGLVGLALAVS